MMSTSFCRTPALAYYFAPLVINEVNPHETSQAQTRVRASIRVETLILTYTSKLGFLYQGFHPFRDLNIGSQFDIFSQA